MANTQVTHTFSVHTAFMDSVIERNCITKMIFSLSTYARRRLLRVSYFQSTVKEKEDAHQDPEIQPMKEDDGTFGEYR